MKKKLLLLLLFFLSLTICQAQFTLSGTVVDVDQQPLAGVSIATDDQAIVAITDSAGNYSFQSSSSLAHFSFSFVGYLTKSFLIKDTPSTIILYRNNDILPGMVVRSFERNRYLQDIPAAVTVLNKAALDRYGSESLVPAINTVPGVKMDERSPGSYRLNIRGNLLRSTFGVRNVKTYWNGIPLTDANGTTYFNELAFNSIDKIEILKGPSGSMYGAGTGGVVLLSSEPDPAKGKSISLHATAGSYGMLSINGSYDQNTVKSNTRLSLSHMQSDGYRSHTDMRRDMVHLTSSYFISIKQNIYANIFYSDLYYQTPGALTISEMAIDPKQSRPAAGMFPGAEGQKAALNLKTFYAGFPNEFRFNDKWSNITSVYISNTKFRNPTIRNYESKREAGIGFRTITQYKKDFFTATIGGEYQYSFTDAGTFGNKGGTPDTLQFQDEILARQFNVFIQADINLKESLVINAGVSYNNFQYGFTRLSQFPLKENNRFKPAIVPRISILKKIKKIFSLYAALSKGFSPPSIDEVRGGSDQFNTNLEAESGMNYEAGVKGTIIKNKCWVDVCYYYFTLNHTIVSRRDSAGGDYFINAGKTRQTGFESSISYLAVNSNNRFLRYLKFWSSYTNVYAKFLDYQQGALKYDGNKLTGTAPNTFLAGADINTSARFYANLSYSYTDRIPLNDANSFYGNPYNLFFSKIGYRVKLKKNMDADIFISYDRSFNTPYSLGNDLNAAGNRFYNPSSPQNVYAGFRIKYIL